MTAEALCACANSNVNILSFAQAEILDHTAAAKEKAGSFLQNSPGSGFLQSCADNLS
jgi:hypothetical protein